MMTRQSAEVQWGYPVYSCTDEAWTIRQAICGNPPKGSWKNSGSAPLWQPSAGKERWTEAGGWGVGGSGHEARHSASAFEEKWGPEAAHPGELPWLSPMCSPGSGWETGGEHGVVAAPAGTTVLCVCVWGGG